MKLQTLMNEFYDIYQKNPELNREDILNRVSDLHKAAVRFGNLNYQVTNGGFSQWEFNGYSSDLNALLLLCDKGISLDIEEFKTLKQMFIEFSEIPQVKYSTETEKCSECNGDGEVEDYDHEDNEIKVTCSECGGSGDLETEVSNEDERDYAFNKLDDKYEEETFLPKMEELIQRWDEIPSDVPKYNVYQESNVKPKCNLKNVDGNVFVIIGHVRKTLNRAGLSDKADEFSKLATQQESYDAVLALLTKYVEVEFY